MRYCTLLLFLAMPSVAAAQQYYHYYPSSPVQLPYYPPVSYGPGNHFPQPFVGYPGHPTSQLYYPYTYAPYSFYYSYPTIDTYRDAYNPYNYNFPPYSIIGPGGRMNRQQPPAKTDGPSQNDQNKK